MTTNLKDKIIRAARHLTFALLTSFALSSCNGGGGGSASTGGDSLVTVQGSLAVAAGDNASKYTVFNSSNQSSTPSSAGSFSSAVAKDSQTYTYAISDTGKKVYAAVSTDSNGPVTINAQSTAEAMVLLNPLLIPRTSAERTAIINIVRADAAVSALAAVITSVYGSVADPLSDTRISNALTNAVKSVLTTWQASSASASAHQQTAQKSFALVHAMSASASGGSSLQIKPLITGNDMGALSLANSTGSTLKLELNTVGPGGITTNVDWVVRIVELDPAKIQWTNSGDAVWGNPTYTDIDSLIKTGGYDQKIIVEGAVGSGLLKFAVDPIGKVADSFGAMVFPDNGINLPHDGVYAVMALSGSSHGDSAEYNSVKNSAWQKSLWAEAQGINIFSAVIDFVGVGTIFANAAGGVVPDISPLLATELAIIKTELTNNPDYVGSNATSYFVGKVADIGDKLLDHLRPYIHSSISDLQSTGLKKFFHVAVNTVKSVVDVWSGSISISTRALNYLFNVTPRESAYAVLGTFSGQDTTPPSAPTSLAATAISSSQINLSWAASTDNVGVAGYYIYRDGNFIANRATPSFSDTGLSPSTQHCYTVSASDAAGNESAQSGTQCATTQANGGSISAAPTGVSTTAGDQSVTISWNAVSGATSYNIYLALDSGVNKSNYSSLANGSKFTGMTSPQLLYLPNGLKHYFVVTAVNANGESIESSQVSETPQAASSTGNYVTQGGLTWMPVASGRYFTWPDANAYCANTTINGQIGWRLPTKDELVNLYNSGAMNGQGWVLSGTWSSTPAYYPGVSMHYRISLDNGDIYQVDDVNSDHVTCVRSNAQSTVVPAPTGVSATAGDGQATISWNAVSGATSYNIYLASVSGVTKSNYSSLANGMKFPGVTNPQSFTGMTNGTTYYFVVTTVNANGESSESSQVSATPQAASSLPPGYVSQGGLTWMPVSSSRKLAWPDANAYCTGTTINGQTGWRLPTTGELVALYASGLLSGTALTSVQGWWLDYTWSSMPYLVGSHYIVFLANGYDNMDSDTNPHFVTCVR